MTVPLSADSPRRRHAIRFGRLLDATLRARGVSRRSLALRLGTSPGLVWQWCAGNNLPRLESALRLADALGEPRLAAIVREARTAPCEACGAPVLAEGGRPVRYCSEACRAVRNAMRGGVPSRERAVVAERRLAIHRDAVAAFCRACCPDGLCDDATCDLRPVSPLPLARSRAPRVAMVEPDPPRAIGPAHRAAIAEANARRWAREGERARMSEAMRARVAARTPEERAAHAAAISAGRRRGRVA